MLIAVVDICIPRVVHFIIIRELTHAGGRGGCHLHLGFRSVLKMLGQSWRTKCLRELSGQLLGHIDRQWSLRLTRPGLGPRTGLGSRAGGRASHTRLRAVPVPGSFLLLFLDVLQIIVAAHGRGSGTIIRGLGAEEPGWLCRLQAFRICHGSGQA